MKTSVEHIIGAEYSLLNNSCTVPSCVATELGTNLFLAQTQSGTVLKTFAMCQVAPISFSLINIISYFLIILCRSDEEESCDEILTPGEASTIQWSPLLSDTTTALRV